MGNVIGISKKIRLTLRVFLITALLSAVLLPGYYAVAGAATATINGDKEQDNFTDSIYVAGNGPNAAYASYERENPATGLYIDPYYVNFVGEDSSLPVEYQNSAIQFDLTGIDGLITLAVLKIYIVDIVGSPYVNLIKTEDNDWSSLSRTLPGFDLSNYITQDLAALQEINITGTGEKAFIVTDYLQEIVDSGSSKISFVLTGREGGAGQNYFGYANYLNFAAYPEVTPTLIVEYTLPAGAPNVSSSNGSETNDTTPTWTWTSGGGGNGTFRYKLDSGDFSSGATITTDTSYTPEAGLTEGMHTLYVQEAYAEGTGRWSASGSITLTIDITAPAPPVPALSPGSDTGVSDADGITADSTPTFTGTAEAGSIVTLYDTEDSTSIGTAAADGSGNWTITSALLSDGSHNITAKAQDAAGNVSMASAGLTVTIDTIAPAAPDVPILAAASDTGISNSDGITKDTTPTFTGTGEAGSMILLYATGSPIGSTSADYDGNWSITASALSQGTHLITAVATDAAGNVSTVSMACSVTIDTSGPTISISGPSPTLTASGPVTYTVTYSEADITLVSENITLHTIGTANGTIDSITGVTGSGTTRTVTVSGITGDGTIRINIAAGTCVDLAGNLADAAEAITGFTADNSPPDAPAGLDLTAASDTGHSDTDNITNVAAPTITGTAEAGSTVTLYSSGTVIGTATANGSGAWSITTSLLPDGVHPITATAADIVGNVSPASAVLTITIITVPPDVPSVPDMTEASDTGISDTDNITRNSAPVFTGTASAGTIITLYSSINGSIGTAAADGSGKWTITAAALSEGSHTITAVAADAFGNTSAASDGLNITVDITSPAAPSSPNLHAASDTGLSSTDNLTSITTPTFGGTAEPHDSITLWDDTVGEVGNASADSSGNWEITTIELTEGYHVIYATATDAAGNTSVISPSAFLTIDITKPTVTVSAPSAVRTGAGPVQYTLTYSETNVTTDNGDITLNRAGTANGTVTVTGTGNTRTVTISDITGDGTIGITVASGTCFDAAGNLSNAAASDTFITVDNTAPDAPPAPDLASSSDTGYSDSDNITMSESMTFHGTAEPLSTITLYAANTVLGTTTADNSGVWSVTVSISAEGNHSITAKARDIVGNESAAGEVLVVTLDKTAPSAPSIPDLTSETDTGISDTDNITKQTTPSFTGTAETGGNLALYSTINGAIGSAMVDSSGNWIITSSVLNEGMHTITAKVTDAAGNISPGSSGLNVTIDTTAPAKPSMPDLSPISDSGSSDTDNVTNVTTPVISGISLPDAMITLTDLVSGLIGTAVSDGSGAWSVAVPALSEGSHSITAMVTDEAGNESLASDPLIITIDTTGPSAVISAPSLTLTKDNAVTYTITYTDAANITLDPSGVILNKTGTADASAISVVNTGTGSSTVELKDFSGDGTIAIAVSAGAASDLAGNTSLYTEALSSFTVDHTPPAIPSIPDLQNTSDTGLSDTDDITKDTTPDFTGAADGGSVIKLYSSIGGLIGTTTADDSGNWSITAAALSNGSHTITATAEDALGNVSAASGGLLLVIDTALPDAYTVTVSAAPAAGGSVTGGGRYNEGSDVQLTATAGSGYFFVRWTENNVTVSQNAFYSFTLGAADRSLIAHFSYDFGGSGEGGSTGNITLPKIAGDSNAEGWTLIQNSIERMIDNLKNGQDSDDTDNTKPLSEITIDMNGSTVLPGAILNIIRGQKVTITLIIAEGIEWVINGEDFTDNEEEAPLGDIDLRVDLDTDNIPEEIIRDLAGEDKNIRQISLAYSGSYGFKAELILNLDQDNKKGKYAYLYYYNPKTKKLELQSIGIVDTNGNTQLSFNHASDYLVVRDNGIILSELLDDITVELNRNVIYSDGNMNSDTRIRIFLPPLLQEAVDLGRSKYTVSYKTSDSKVATVSADGTIHAVKPGKAIITATIKVDDMERTFTKVIIVNKAHIKLVQSTKSMNKGSDFTFAAIGYGVDTRKIVWSTTQKSIVVIDKLTGEAKAKAKGVDYVVAKCGKISVQVQVTVK